MTIETDRLILEPWMLSDCKAFRPIATDADVMRYITGGLAWTDAQIRSFVEGQINLYCERAFCRWKVLDKQSRGLIGFCGPGIWRDAPDPEIGWWLARRLWGQGLATEAARAALKDAFERVRLARLISIARPENLASIRIMNKLGLHFEAAFTRDGISMVQYAIEQAQYTSSQESNRGK